MNQNKLNYIKECLDESLCEHGARGLVSLDIQELVAKDLYYSMDGYDECSGENPSYILGYKSPQQLEIEELKIKQAKIDSLRENELRAYQNTLARKLGYYSAQDLSFNYDGKFLEITERMR